jgi:hypothetical protein
MQANTEEKRKKCRCECFNREGKSCDTECGWIGSWAGKARVGRVGEGGLKMEYIYSLLHTWR